MDVTLIMLVVLALLLIFGAIILYKDKKENLRLEAYSKTAKEMNALLCAINVDSDIVYNFNEMLLNNKEECILNYFKNKKPIKLYNYKHHALYNMLKISKSMRLDKNITEYEDGKYKK